jgi:hypothetical protein
MAEKPSTPQGDESGVQHGAPTFVLRSPGKPDVRIPPSIVKEPADVEAD